MSDKTDDGRFGLVDTFRVYYPACGGGMTTKKGGLSIFWSLNLVGWEIFAIFAAENLIDRVSLLL